MKFAPENTDYIYNFGLLYYNEAGLANTAMSNFPLSDEKGYNELKATRDARFVKAQPYFEKVCNILDLQALTLSEDDKATYINALTALREIYSRLGNNAKTKEVINKINSLKK